ncbi:MAG: CPBP family intramembrane glutamic endopeptidase [Enterococcus sp.]
MENRSNNKNAAWIALGLTILVGGVFQLLGKILSPDTTKFIAYPLEALFTLVFCGLVGYFFLRKEFLEQFKHFKWSVLLWGVPLTFATSFLFGQLYTYLVGPTTENVAVISFSLLLRMPFMLMGEELISTNVMIALQKKGWSFPLASIACGVLFAIWHIPAYGFVPLQLLMTIMLPRLALNYIWKKSNSVWVSWLCHYLFDSIPMLIILVLRPLVN